ncbi:uncharacterized protein LOC119074925 [Bradysia coprophila]|uniref:uncharacterized protein LOC119074925 n=1 Tax=Bradysia coprophila TaxID=38358 RepID=UPI00187D9576|nr:uncharacterized protein LOC119074925 [Bradysia coprophila]
MFVNEHTLILKRYIDFGQFFGLAPISILPFSTNFTKSTVKFAMSLVYLLLQIGHVIFHIMKTYDHIQLTKMSNIIHYVWMFNCLLTNVFVTTHSLIVANHLVAYINQLESINQEIQSDLQTAVNCQRQHRKHSLIMIFVTATSFVSTWMFYGLVAFFYPQLTSLFSFIFIPTAFMSIRVFQIIHSIELLNDHLDIINGLLRSIDRIPEDNRKRTLIVLRHLYGRCWNAMQLFNACFGFSNLMLLLFYSYDVLHGIYVLFLNMHGLRPDLAILFGVSFLPSAVNLFAITNAAERCRNKAKETGVCLGNIWNMPWCHTDLKRFSVQVIHQQFLTTACGFFVVDFKSLAGLVVGFSNLLLLFLQFEVSEKAATN